MRGAGQPPAAGRHTVALLEGWWGLPVSRHKSPDNHPEHPLPALLRTLLGVRVARVRPQRAVGDYSDSHFQLPLPAGWGLLSGRGLRLVSFRLRNLGRRRARLPRFRGATHVRAFHISGGLAPELGEARFQVRFISAASTEPGSRTGEAQQSQPRGLARRRHPRCSLRVEPFTSFHFRASPKVRLPSGTNPATGSRFQEMTEPVPPGVHLALRPMSSAERSGRRREVSRMAP
jgi:hypothetical protein